MDGLHPCVNPVVGILVGFFFLGPAGYDMQSADNLI